MGGGTCVHAVRPGAGPERPGRRGRASTAGTRDLRGATAAGPDSTWNVVASMPQPLYGAAGASNGTYAYAAGGIDVGGATLDTFYRYNPVNERWDTYPPPMPAAEAKASAVYYPATNSIYVFGGVNSSTDVVTDATRVFDITANTWSSAANMPGPRHSMAAGYDSANQRMYLVGGYDTADPASAQTTVWEYNPAANTFTTRAPIPHAVGGAASGVIGNHFYVAGGQDASGAIIDLVWDYSVATNSWSAGASVPTPTNAAGSAVANGRLWIFGGETPGAATGTTTAYDPGAGGWNEAPSLNVPRAWIGGTAIANTLVAAGGRSDSTSLATTEVLDAGTASCADPTTTFSEDFDGVTPPTLPAGWTTTNDQGRRCGRRRTPECPRRPSILLRTQPSSTTPRS